MPTTGVTLGVGRTLATDMHQVDSPVIDRLGRIYATFSGSRGEDVPVSIFRVTPGRSREPFSSAVVNATSMTIGPDQALYVSSRFEGTVSRLADDGSAALVASNLGVPCGLAFGPDGALYVGDRSGTVFRVERRIRRRDRRSRRCRRAWRRSTSRSVPTAGST